MRPQNKFQIKINCFGKFFRDILVVKIEPPRDIKFQNELKIKHEMKLSAN